MFDLNKIKSAAERIGLDLEFNSENPGMHFVMSDGSIDELTFSDLQTSLNNEFKKDQLKSKIHYNLEFKSGPRLDIGSNQEETQKSDILNEIVISVDGCNKVSNFGQRPTELDSDQYMHYNAQSNNGAA